LLFFHSMKNEVFPMIKRPAPWSNNLIVTILFLLSCVLISDCDRKELAVSKTETAPFSQREIKVKFGPLYFDNYKTVLTPEAMTFLYDAGAFLSNNMDYNIIIESYSDDGCGEPYSNWLSEERAKDIRNWLVVNGPYKISEKRITVQSFGDKKPLNDTCGEDSVCHSKNRRVELTAVKSTKTESR
jgi:outer membrane protein OmpA-like peptidoglycan-associated protein